LQAGCFGNGPLRRQFKPQTTQTTQKWQRQNALSAALFAAEKWRQKDKKCHGRIIRPAFSVLK
jgi:hypothetical protein